MSTHSPNRRRTAELIGRNDERGVLDQLVEAVGGGLSRALVVRGEPGSGKTALLECVIARASGFRVARAAGVQSEMELAFAGLHQLLSPMLDRLERLPVPQRDALRTVFGVSPGPAPGRFVVGLAVLGLFSEVAEERPLICVVDDEQWLDRASAQVLALIARRLEEESVALIFAARGSSDDLVGLPELVVGGPAGGRCAIEPGDRHTAVHQPAHGQVPTFTRSSSGSASARAPSSNVSCPRRSCVHRPRRRAPPGPRTRPRCAGRVSHPPMVSRRRSG